MARSGVALAMEHWGCREDHNRWRRGHPAGAIEGFLSESPIKYLGDAWMLAQALIERHSLPNDEKTETLVAVRVRGHGRWTLTPAPQTCEPMAASAAHWRRPASEMLFEPAARAGLGIEPSALLLQVGVVAVEHCSAYAGGKKSIHYIPGLDAVPAPAQLGLVRVDSDRAYGAMAYESHGSFPSPSPGALHYMIGPPH